MGLKIETKNCIRNSLVVRWLELCILAVEGQLQSTMRELGSHKLHHGAKKKKLFHVAISVTLRQLNQLVHLHSWVNPHAVCYILVSYRSVCCISFKIFASIFIKRDYPIVFLSFFFCIILVKFYIKDLDKRNSKYFLLSLCSEAA